MNEITIDASQASEENIEAIAVELWDVVDVALDQGANPEEIILAIHALQETVVSNFLTVESVH